MRPAPVARSSEVFVLAVALDEARNRWSVPRLVRLTIRARPTFFPDLHRRPLHLSDTRPQTQDPDAASPARGAAGGPPDPVPATDDLLDPRGRRRAADWRLMKIVELQEPGAGPTGLQKSGSSTTSARWAPASPGSASVSPPARRLLLRFVQPGSHPRLLADCRFERARCLLAGSNSANAYCRVDRRRSSSGIGPIRNPAAHVLRCDRGARRTSRDAKRNFAIHRDSARSAGRVGA